MRRNPEQAKALDNKLQDQISSRAKYHNVLTRDQLDGEYPATSQGDKVTILYGSETGNAEEQAKSLWADVKARGQKADISSLDDFDFDELQNCGKNWPLAGSFCARMIHRLGNLKP